MRSPTACATGGVEGFVAAYGEPNVADAVAGDGAQGGPSAAVAHEHLEALADALRAVPRSQPFGSIGELGAISAPTVVASDDEADPEHPRAMGEAYAAAIPGARLVTDEPGRSPIAWQGSQLSRVIAEVAQMAARERRSRPGTRARRWCASWGSSPAPDLP